MTLEQHTTHTDADGGPTPRSVHVTELTTLVGAALGPTPWHLIDQRRIAAFADATDDHQWIHLDKERAAAGPFGATIAHGFLTLSMTTTLSQELIAVQGVTAVINYGLNKVRFGAPVSAGTRIRATGSVTNVRNRPRGLIEMAMRLSLDAALADGPTRVCSAETLTLLQPEGL